MSSVVVRRYGYRTDAVPFVRPTFIPRSVLKSRRDRYVIFLNFSYHTLTTTNYTASIISHERNAISQLTRASLRAPGVPALTAVRNCVQ